MTFEAQLLFLDLELEIFFEILKISVKHILAVVDFVFRYTFRNDS